MQGLSCLLSSLELWKSLLSTCIINMHVYVYVYIYIYNAFSIVCLIVTSCKDDPNQR